jgi:hypothetical protein
VDWDCNALVSPENAFNYTLAQQLHDVTGHKVLILIDSPCLDYMVPVKQTFISNIIQSPLFGGILFLEHNPPKSPPGFYYKRGLFFGAWNDPTYPAAWITVSDGQSWIKYGEENSNTTNPTLVKLHCNTNLWGETFSTAWVDFIIDGFGVISLCIMLYGIQVHDAHAILLTLLFLTKLYVYSLPLF